MRRSRFSGVALLTVLTAASAFASCADDGAEANESGGGDTETPGNQDSDTSGDDSKGPACEPDGGALGQPCDKENLCDCDHICGYQAFGEAVDGGEAVTNYCFLRCDPKAPDCGANHACVPRPGERSLCLPTGRITAGQFEAKVFSATAQATAEDTNLDQEIAGSLGGEAFPAKNAAVGVYDPKTKTHHLIVVMGGTGGDIWTLDVRVPQKKWTPGTWKVGGFSAALFRSGSKPPQLWYEAEAVRGTLKIEAAPAPCETGGDACEPMRASFDLELVGMRTEIKASQQPKR